ncbi:MAG TPA: hypothetical protein VF645_05165, partial [Allosphingosinicella sp.]
MSGLGKLRAAAMALAVSAPAMALGQASPSVGTSAARYDLMRREVGTIAPDADGVAPWSFLATRKTYDPAGRLTRVESGHLSAWQPETIAPAAWTGFTIVSQVDTLYDSMNRKVREAASGSGVTTGVTEFSYDQAGRLRCTAVRMNPDVWATPLPDKCVPGPVHAVDGPDRIARNGYTVHGEVKTIERAVGTGLQQVYASYTYSPNGKATSVTDANGNKAEMTWDGLDRQKSWTFPCKTVPGDSNPADYEEYGYDPNANRTSLRKRDGSILTYQYDALNRMSVKIVPERSGLTAAQTRDVHYAYDNRGLPTEARFDSLAGEGVTNVYDGFGQLSSSTLAMGGNSRTVAHQYDGNGNRTRITLPPAILPSQPQYGLLTFFFDYRFDGLDRLKSVANAGGNAVGSWTWGLNGRLESQVRNTAPPSLYSYDAVSRPLAIAHDLAGTAYDL